MQMQVTLLGTGCPIVDPHRMGPATLVEGGGAAWLVDCGSGVSQRLQAHGRSGAALSGLLLTHLHSDHTVDLMQLLISGWHQGRQHPLRVFGPRGTRAFLEAIRAAWEPELRQRQAHEGRQAGGVSLEITEIGPGWEHAEDGLTIRLAEVRHQPVPQAFAFRFDRGGAAAVVSGDTTYSPELIALAQGCGLLVHETFLHGDFVRQRPHLPPQVVDNLAAYHTRSEDVGRVAAQAGAGHLALTHFVPTVFDRAALLRDVRRHYGGGLSIGEDLMSFALGGERPEQPGAVALLRGGAASHP